MTETTDNIAPILACIDEPRELVLRCVRLLGGPHVQRLHEHPYTGLLRPTDVLLIGRSRLLVSIDPDDHTVWARAVALRAPHVRFLVPHEAWLTDTAWVKAWLSNGGWLCECTPTYSCAVHAGHALGFVEIVTAELVDEDDEDA